MIDRDKKYSLIKNNIEKIIQNSNLKNTGIEVVVEKDNETVYVVNFYNSNPSAELMILKNEDYRPFNFVSFEVIGLVNGEVVIPYFFYDDEKSTIEDITNGINKVIEYLIKHENEYL